MHALQFDAEQRRLNRLVPTRGIRHSWATDNPVQDRPYLVTRVTTSRTRFDPKVLDRLHLARKVPQNPHSSVDFGAESQGPCHRVPPILHCVVTVWSGPTVAPEIR